MKYLSDYMEKKQSKLFKDKKCFFAFSNKQLKEGLTTTQMNNKNIVSLGGGMYCPRINAKFVVNKLDEIYIQSIKQDLKENGKEKVIYRELSNYESWYVNNYTECIEALKDYSITEKEIKDVYLKHCKREYLKY